MNVHEANGRCATCGFLAVQRNTKVEGAYALELSQRRRRLADVFTVIGQGVGERPADPVCLKGMIFFEQEAGHLWEERHVQRLSGDKAIVDVVREILHKNRECSGWRQYRPGVEPMVFVQLTMHEDLEHSRRQWQTDLEAMREQSNARERRTDRRMAWLALLIAAIGLLSMTADSLLTVLVKALFVGTGE